MAFNSWIFLLFISVLFLVYWNVKQELRLPVLLIFNLIFYIFSDIRYLPALIIVILASYFGGIARKRIWQKLAIALLICNLILLKYSMMILNTIYAFRVVRPDYAVQMIVPLGISFYTFEAISYLADIMTEKTEPERRFFVVATGISFFPTVVSGPIKRLGTFREQLIATKEFNYDQAINAVRRIAVGFFMKYAVADTMGRGVDNVFNHIRQCQGGILLVASVMFTIQIYADFVGYSHIAIGLAELLGFEIPENFKQPYFAVSLKDFWRRWHISLSTWFRDYVYIPLGGNRRGKGKKYNNLMITFLVSGLWHGAGWNYVLWGGVHGVGQVVDHMLGLDGKIRQTKSRAVKIISWLIVMMFVNFAWVLFRLNTVSEISYFFSNVLYGVENILNYVRITKSYFAMDRLGNVICALDVVLLLTIEVFSTNIEKWIEFGNRFKTVRIAAEISFALVTIIIMIKGDGVGFIYEGF